MAITKRSDLVIPEILTEAIRGEFSGQLALWGTGAAATMFTMPLYGPSGAQIKFGDRVKIPYFGTLGELDDVTETDALTPQALSMSGEEARVIHSGKAVEMSNWAILAANYIDPYGEFARQFRVMTMRRADRALLEAATAELPATNVDDISDPNNPRNVDYDALIDAKMLWGDEQNDIALFSCHSGVYKNLLKLKDSTGRPLIQESLTEGVLNKFCGIPLAVSDRNARFVDPSGLKPTRYRSLIVKRNALAWWANEEPTILTDSDILAHTELSAVHLYHAAHRYLRTPGATKPGVVAIVSNG